MEIGYGLDWSCATEAVSGTGRGEVGVPRLVSSPIVHVQSCRQYCISLQLMTMRRLFDLDSGICVSDEAESVDGRCEITQWSRLFSFLVDSSEPSITYHKHH